MRETMSYAKENISDLVSFLHDNWFDWDSVKFDEVAKTLEMKFCKRCGNINTIFLIKFNNVLFYKTEIKERNVEDMFNEIEINENETGVLLINLLSKIQLKTTLFSVEIEKLEDQIIHKKWWQLWR